MFSYCFVNCLHMLLAALETGRQGDADTITVSIDEMTQLLLQQHGIESAAAVQLEDGSYQLFFDVSGLLYSNYYHYLSEFC